MIIMTYFGKYISLHQHIKNTYNIPLQEKINFDYCFHKENKYRHRVLSFYTLRIVNKNLYHRNILKKFTVIKHDLSSLIIVIQ